MRFIFFGTSNFAAHILKKLLAADLIPLAIITNPDRPFGRKKTITPPPVKKTAIELMANHLQKTDILQPESLDERFAATIKNYQPELGILIAYGKIIPKTIINLFPKGIIVIHPSLLPKYRGATPIQNALLNNEKETGSCLLLMDEQIDHGPILNCIKVSINHNDNYEKLSGKLAKKSASLLIKTLPQYLAHQIKPVPQNHRQATYTEKFSIRDSFVDLIKDPPKTIWLKTRALNPEPGVWTIWKNNKRLKIIEADLKEGRLIFKKIQFAGEKPKYYDRINL